MSTHIPVTDMESRRFEAEIAQLLANTMKLQADAMKIQAEQRKLTTENRWYPLIAGAAFFGAAIAFVKLLL